MSKIYHSLPKVRVTVESESIDEIALMLKGIDFARNINTAVDKISNDQIGNADGEVFYSAEEVKTMFFNLLPMNLHVNHILGELENKQS